MINHGVSPCYIDGTQPVLPASLPRKVPGHVQPALETCTSAPHLAELPANQDASEASAETTASCPLHHAAACGPSKQSYSTSLQQFSRVVHPWTCAIHPAHHPTSTNRGPTHLWTIPLQLQATSQQHAGAVVVAAFHIQQIQQLCWLLLTIIAYYSHD